MTVIYNNKVLDIWGCACTDEAGATKAYVDFCARKGSLCREKKDCLYRIEPLNETFFDDFKKEYSVPCGFFILLLEEEPD